VREENTLKGYSHAERVWSNKRGIVAESGRCERVKVSVVNRTCLELFESQPEETRFPLSERCLIDNRSRAGHYFNREFSQRAPRFLFLLQNWTSSFIHSGNHISQWVLRGEIGGKTNFLLAYPKFSFVTWSVWKYFQRYIPYFFFSSLLCGVMIWDWTTLTLSCNGFSLFAALDLLHDLFETVDNCCWS